MTAQTLNQAGAKARVSRRAVVRGAGVAGAGALVAMRTPVASLFGKFVVEPGDIDVFAGDSSKAALTQSFTVNA